LAGFRYFLPEAGEKNLSDLVFQTELTIKNADGLHMRPAMQFVDIASGFKSRITIIKGSLEVDGKSIMQVSMLAATYGTTLAVKAEGSDAKKAIEALKELVEVKLFGEPPPAKEEAVKAQKGL
jgi:phosphocarrier protein HPr